jgi:hypothetical protein
LCLLIFQVGAALVDIDTESVIEKAVTPAAPTAQSQPVRAPQTAAVGVVPFKLADIGEGIAEVELLKWFVNVSQPVRSSRRRV